jgi:hypothetical protein
MWNNIKVARQAAKMKAEQPQEERIRCRCNEETKKSKRPTSRSNREANQPHAGNDTPSSLTEQPHKTTHV